MALKTMAVDADESLGPFAAEVAKGEVVREVVEEVGLPESYLMSKERMVRAMEVEDVATRDRAEMERGGWREGGDRPHSGYA